MPTPTSTSTPPLPLYPRPCTVTWRVVEDHVDALVRAFTSEDDAVVVVTDEGDVVNNGDRGVVGGDVDTDEDGEDGSDASLDDAASDICG